MEVVINEENNVEYRVQVPEEGEQEGPDPPEENKDVEVEDEVKDRPVVVHFSEDITYIEQKPRNRRGSDVASARSDSPESITESEKSETVSKVNWRKRICLLVLIAFQILGILYIIRAVMEKFKEIEAGKTTSMPFSTTMGEMADDYDGTTIFGNVLADQMNFE